jgi:glycosyltransferase
MRVTVITACRNAAPVIGDCVSSVFRQTHPDVEHWILDGASTDGTLDAVAAVPRPVGKSEPRILSEPDGGLYEALNKGLGLACGGIVGFLHADDWFAHDEVLAHVAAALGDPGVDACYGDLEYVEPEPPHRVVRSWRAGPFRRGAFSDGWMPPHPTFYAKREVYGRHGGFDTRMRLGADWELLLRLLEIEKIAVRYLPEVMVRMRTGGLSNRSWGNILRNNWECFRAFRRHGMKVPWTYPLRKARHRLSQFR